MKYINGYIVQEDKNPRYRGVDGSGFSDNTADNWYLNDIPGYEEKFRPFYEENIALEDYFLDLQSHVGACTDLGYIRDYIKASEELGIKYRVMLVKTDIPQPVCEMDESVSLKFLGYDYAYAMPNYYSAVYNEVEGIFPQFKLNGNGLFETEEDIREYLKTREEFVKTHRPYTLESGDFAVFEIYEVALGSISRG